MDRKYELTDKVMRLRGTLLSRIRAVRDFGDVREGDLGGWVEREENLSHDGDAWISGDAQVYGDARVFEDAQVFGGAE